MRRLVPVVLLGLALLALSVLAAGCGARNSDPFTATGTIPCLKKAGWTVTTNQGKIGFIAAFAARGGLRATPPDHNTVTIAFTQDPGSVTDTVDAFRRHASATLRPHFSDVARTSRNAVIIWTTSPTDADSSTVDGCLKP